MLKVNASPICLALNALWSVYNGTLIETPYDPRKVRCRAAYTPPPQLGSVGTLFGTYIVILRKFFLNWLKSKVQWKLSGCACVFQINCLLSRPPKDQPCTRHIVHCKKSFSEDISYFTPFPSVLPKYYLLWISSKTSSVPIPEDMHIAQDTLSTSWNLLWRPTGREYHFANCVLPSCQS